MGTAFRGLGKEGRLTEVSSTCVLLHSSVGTGGSVNCLGNRVGIGRVCVQPGRRQTSNYYGEGATVREPFPRTQTSGGILNRGVFPGAQGSGEIQHCHLQCLCVG